MLMLGYGIILFVFVWGIFVICQTILTRDGRAEIAKRYTLTPLKFFGDTLVMGGWLTFSWGVIYPTSGTIFIFGGLTAAAIGIVIDMFARDTTQAEIDEYERFAIKEEQRLTDGRKPVKSKADDVVAIPHGAIDQASKMWRKMLTTHAGPSDLKNFIRRTRGIFTDALKEHFYELENAPDEILMQIYAMGVRKAETHTKKEIEKAFGFPLPEDD